MSYFVYIPLLVFICKLKRIDYLGWTRESYFVCYRLLVIIWILLGGVSSSS